MPHDRISLTTRGPVAYLTLNRPDRHNGVDRAMLDAMSAAQAELRGMRELRAVIVRGEGPSFCAGLDFASVLAQPTTMAGMVAELWKPTRNLFQRWSMGFRELGLPVLAAVHGNCFGAGIQLALGADVRFATRDARISLMEAKWGLVPDMGGIAAIRELLPIDVAKELTMTGRILSGEQAHALGLVTHLADDPVAAAEALAAEIATRSPDSVAASKFLLQEAYEADEDDALTAERRWQRRLLGFENQRISIARNREKRDLPFGRRRIG